MSAAAASADDAPPKGNKKKLILILAVVLLLVLGGGGAAFFMLKKKPADDEEGDGGPAAHAPADVKPVKFDPKHAPVFVPLDPFVVNLADKGVERYAQIGVTLEIQDAATGEALKAYMPAIRNNILLLLAHKTSEELLSADGKLKLATQIRGEAVRPLGYEVDDEDEGEQAADDAVAARKKKKKKKPQQLPVTQAHFSNFIIQ